MFINFATAFFNVVEDAEPAAIFQFDKTMPVIMHKLLFIVTCSFQTFNVCTGKYHSSLFTTYSAMRAVHEQFCSNFLLLVLSISDACLNTNNVENWLSKL